MKRLIILITLLFAAANLVNCFGYNEKHYARFFIKKICHNCDLYKANFSGVDLTNADFTGSNLISANFQNATLYGAILKDTSLAGANFNGAMWIDGSICEQGSYGSCKKRKKQ
ncbi:MAG: pentapeptide repeat-containing protein [Proteobacteria bacterium]|nr:pentapeptide repeat-containing protein [Pseudomonadota bacterium]